MASELSANDKSSSPKRRLKGDGYSETANKNFDFLDLANIKKVFQNNNIEQTNSKLEIPQINESRVFIF